jgi:tight adherence protein B
MFGIRFDPALAIQVLIFAAVFTACQAGWGLVRHGGAKKAVNLRLKLVEGGMALSDIVGELRKRRGMGQDGRHRMSWIAWIADLVVRSGIPYQPRRWAVMIAALGGAMAFLAFALTRSIVIAAGVGVAAATLPPFGYLKFMANRRAKGLSEQLPHALEVIVRSLEAGHPVPTAIALVGRELPDPIGSEFGMAADEIAFGATLEQAVARIADRCRHADVDLFAAAIRLQEKAGGNLTGLLKMLARTIRERNKMRLKIRAASAEGRMSAYILTGAPIVCFIFINVSQPHYYGDILHVKFIQIGLGCLLALLTTGNLVMKRMIDMRI